MKHNTILDKASQEKNASLKAGFLNQWTPAQFKTMKTAISRHFSNKYFSGRNMHFQPMPRTFENIDSIAGLAFTSSSSYAGYWVCNDEIVCSKYAGYKYIGFAMTEGNTPFAILWDASENEIITPL